MAFIRLKNGSGKFVTAEQGATIWRVLNGEIKGTKEQRDFCGHVHKVYLNRSNAPQSWIDANPPTVEMFPSRGRKKAVAANAIRLPYID